MASKQSKNLIKVKKQNLGHKINYILERKQLVDEAVNQLVNNAISASQQVQNSTEKHLQKFNLKYDWANSIAENCLEKLFEIIALCEEDSGDDTDEEEEDDAAASEDMDDVISVASLTGASFPSSVCAFQIAPSLKTHNKSALETTCICNDSTKIEDSEKLRSGSVDPPETLDVGCILPKQPAEDNLDSYVATETPVSGILEDVDICGDNSSSQAVKSSLAVVLAAPCGDNISPQAVESPPATIFAKPCESNASSQTLMPSAAVDCAEPCQAINSLQVVKSPPAVCAEPCGDNVLSQVVESPPATVHADPCRDNISSQAVKSPLAVVCADPCRDNISSQAVESPPAVVRVDPYGDNISSQAVKSPPAVVRADPYGDSISSQAVKLPPSVVRDEVVLPASSKEFALTDTLFASPVMIQTDRVSSDDQIRSLQGNGQVNHGSSEPVECVPLDPENLESFGVDARVDKFKNLMTELEGWLKREDSLDGKYTVSSFMQHIFNNSACSPPEPPSKHSIENKATQDFKLTTEVSASSLLPINVQSDLLSVLNDSLSHTSKVLREDFQSQSGDLYNLSPVQYLLPKTRLDEGSSLEGLITYVESPSSFYLQPLDADCDRLSDSLSAHYKNTYRSLPESEQKVGMLCCVRNVKSSTWMRGVIIAIKKKETPEQAGSLNDKFTVKFIDYGWSEDVPLYLLRSLDSSFLSTPTLAVHCTLFEVEPPLSQKTWNADQIVMFRELTCNKTIKVIVREIHEMVNDSLYEVDLYEVKIRSNQEIEISISDCLARAKCCRYPKKKDGTISKKDDTPSRSVLLEEPFAPKVSFKIAMPPPVSTAKVTLDDDDSSVSSECTANGYACQEVEKHASSKRLTFLQEEKDLAQACEQQPECHIPLSTFSTEAAVSEVMLSHVVSPSEFYVHPKEVSTEIDQLYLELKAEYADSVIPPVFTNQEALKVNSVWCAKYPKEEGWFRAKVLKVREAEERQCKASDSDIKKHQSSSMLPKLEVLMFYVDYGDSAWISPNDLRKLKQKFFALPAMAVGCSLANVQPKNGKLWSSEACEYLKNWAHEKIIKVKVINENDYQNTHLYKVWLWNFSYDSSNNAFNDQLVKLDMATFVVPEHQHSLKCAGSENSSESRETNELKGMVMTNGHESDEIEELESWNPMQSEHGSIRNSYNIDIDDAGVALTGYKARDEKDICLFIQRRQACKRGNTCPYKHIKPHEDGKTTDQKETAYYVPQILLPDIGAVVAVEVTAVISPTHFYVNFPISSKPLTKLMEEDEMQPSQEMENLTTLRAKMQDAYVSKCSRDNDYLLPAMGELVVSEFSKDRAWYRAKVVDIKPEKNEVEVFYVDYGNTEWVKEKKIRKIRPEFLHLPFQAVECQLAKIELLAKTKDQLKEATDFFCRCISDTRLVAKIIDKIGNVLQIELFNASTETSFSLNLALANKKYVTTSKNSTSKQNHSSSKVPYLPV